MVRPRFFLVLFLSLFLLPNESFATIPYGSTWYTFYTDHFHVHHSKEKENLARQFAIALEKALPKLTKDLGWQPTTPIDIVINDSADTANGMAVSYPNTYIEIYGVPFDSDSVLMDYQNWIEELATHELTHIVANDTAFGFYQTLRSIFGSIIKPNGLQSTWLVEGLAVFEETKQTNGGRGRSVFTEAFLRAASYEHELSGAYSLDRFNDGYDWWWPSGNAAYLLGYTALAGTENHPNAERSNPGLLSEKNGWQLPYRLNSTLEKVIGEDWQSSWQKTAAKIETRYNKNNKDSDAYCQITHSGRFTGGEALSPDGWLYFSEEDSQHGYSFARVRADAACGNKKVERLYTKDYPSSSQVSVSTNGEHVLFSVLDQHHTYSLLTDIYRYDVKSDHSTKLTHGMRLSAPAYVPDSDNFVAIRMHRDTTESLDLWSAQDGKQIKELYHSLAFERLANPVVSDGNVYFSKHDNQGNEELFVLDMHTLAVIPVVTGFAKGQSFTEKDPFLAKDGTLYFTGDYPSIATTRSFAVYRFGKKDAEPVKIAENASGMLVHPVVEGNHLFAAGYGTHGFDLFRIDLSKNAVANLPEEKEDLNHFLTGNDVPTNSASTTPTLSPSVPYDPFSTPATSLWPQYWMPLVDFAVDGALLGASTSGSDPLGYDSYGISAAYDTRANFPTYSAYYLNQQHPINFRLTADQSNNYFQSEESSNRDSVYSAEALYRYNKFLLSLGAAYQERDLFGVSSENIFLFDNFIYDNSNANPSAIAPNRGGTTKLYLGVYPSERSENTFVDVRPDAWLYFPGFEPSHSVSAEAHFAVTTNHFLSNNYYLGGGASVLSSSSYIVRGYPLDSLLGQRIATVNLAYTLPIARPYRGLGTNPFFLKDIGMRFLFDAGSANYLSVYSGKTELGYRGQPLGFRTITGTGAELLAETKLFYYIPTELSIGIHQGLNTRFGGETILYFGFSVGNFGATSSKIAQH